MIIRDTLKYDKIMCNASIEFAVPDPISGADLHDWGSGRRPATLDTTNAISVC